MPGKDSDIQATLREMSRDIGNLIGKTESFQLSVQQQLDTTTSKLAVLNAELDALAVDSHRRHSENVKSINDNHAENAQMMIAHKNELSEHKEEDRINFASVNGNLSKVINWKYALYGAWVMLAGMIAIMWKVLQLIWPTLEQIRLGE